MCAYVSVRCLDPVAERREYPRIVLNLCFFFYLRCSGPIKSLETWMVQFMVATFLILRLAFCSCAWFIISDYSSKNSRLLKIHVWSGWRWVLRKQTSEFVRSSCSFRFHQAWGDARNFDSLCCIIAVALTGKWVGKFMNVANFMIILGVCHSHFMW